MIPLSVPSGAGPEGISALEAAAENALEIWDGGACNPRAIARALVCALDAAADARIPDDLKLAAQAPARIMMGQLAFLLKTSFSSLGGYKHTDTDHIKDYDFCQNFTKVQP